MEYKIQKIKKTELPQLLKLFHDALKKDFPEYQPKTAIYYKNHYNEEYFSKFLDKKKNTILGAYSDNKIIGFLLLEGQFGGVCVVTWFVVDRRYRNKGVGSKLLDSAEKWSLSEKRHYIFLYTENDNNINYYKKRGYRYIGVQQNSWFGVDEYIMEKHLRNKPFDEVWTNKL